ncbi:MAG: hypothetical protein FD167_2458 [bacterium]|nr:MAG: hypothetical protein FD167_2458 [bacterium]
MFSFSNRRYFLLSFLLLISSSLLAFPSKHVRGQNTTTFQDPDGKYTLDLPPNWKAVTYQDGAGKERVDIIYRDRAFGLLKVTQESVSGSTLEAFIQSDIDQNLRFRPGYVYNGVEKFGGSNLPGQLLQFDFSTGGQPKKGRNYYLRADGQTIWVLRFAGKRDVFSPLRHESDAIARSFKLIK